MSMDPIHDPTVDGVVGVSWEDTAPDMQTLAILLTRQLARAASTYAGAVVARYDGATHTNHLHIGSAGFTAAVAWVDELNHRRRVNARRRRHPYPHKHRKDVTARADQPHT